ncbi:hypothetical protein [Granulicoccus sp. GXG6511]|uniref:hypothetical protein n=1 Tax=Granulicoccus sp. GXG6511 TaxID=3381351 RepID=UPI003D7EDFEE
MPANRHPVRDGIIAVAVGGVLALLLLVGVRAAQDVAAFRPADPAGEPGVAPADACLIRDGAGGTSEPDPQPGPEFPRQEHRLNTGMPVEAHGTGNAEVAYERLGDFATVVEFQCDDCVGHLSLFNTGAALPIVSGEAAGEGFDVVWLIDTIHEMSDGPHNSLLITAHGNWTLTLRSWHDLPVQQGPLKGQGAQVVRVDSPSVRLSFAPLNSRDTLNAYAYRLDDRGFTANLCIGRFESQVLDLNGGEILLIWARGEWTLES